MTIRNRKSIIHILWEYFQVIYRAVLVLSITAVSITISLALAVIIVPFSRTTYIALNTRYVLMKTARLLLMVIGVKRRRGYNIKTSNTLFVSNHWGYLDSLLLMAMSPCLVISSSEVRRMPIIGSLMSMMGFFFVDRGNKRSIPLILKKAAQIATETGLNFALFPEGATDDGSELLPFHSPFFQLAKTTGYDIQPLAFNIVAIGKQKVTAHNINKIIYHGPALTGTSVVHHILQLFRVRTIDIRVDVFQELSHEEIRESEMTRKQICNHCEELIRYNFSSMVFH